MTQAIDLIQSLAAVVATVGLVFMVAIALSILSQATVRWLDRYEKRGLIGRDQNDGDYR